MDTIDNVFTHLYGKWKAKDIKPEEEESVEGKIVLITGADGGIGKCAVREFAKRGAKVIMACMEISDGERTIKEIRETTLGGELFVHKLELSDLESVRRFAREIILSYPHINILICNAGILYDKMEILRTNNGLEKIMAINYFGHFLLTNLLLDHVQKGAPSRIIFASSGSYISSNLKVEKLNFDGLSRHPNLRSVILPYANSKLCLMLLAQELAIRLENKGVTTYSYCPGPVSTTIWQNGSRMLNIFSKILLAIAGHPPEKACQIILYTALAKQTRCESGLMYRNNAIWARATKNLKKKQNFGKIIFEKSERLVGLNEDI